MAVQLKPLTWNVPIVNDKRAPTKEFMLKWQQLNKAAGSIVNLSTPAEVSAVIDILTGGAVNGSLLVRSGGTWQGYPSPSNGAKFLSGNNPPTWQDVDDADLAMSDVTTNNVSTSKHGFAPKLPNDATKYLDGTGNYTVPPTGSSTIGVQLSKQSGNQAITGFTHTKINWDTTDYADSGFTVSLANDTITVADAGYYAVQVFTRFTTSPNISDILTLDVNGTLLRSGTQATRAGAVSSVMTALIKLAANDVLTAYIDTDAGVTLNNTATIPSCMLWQVFKV